MVRLIVRCPLNFVCLVIKLIEVSRLIGLPTEIDVSIGKTNNGETYVECDGGFSRGASDASDTR